MGASAYCYGKITGVCYHVVYPETSIDSSGDGAYLESYAAVVYEDDEGKPFLELPWRQSKNDPFIYFAQYRYSLPQRNLIYWIMRNEDKVLYVVIFFVMLFVTIGYFR